VDSKINDGFSSQTLFHQVIPLVPTTVGTPPPSKGDFLALNPYLELMLTNQSIKEVEKMKNQVLILLLATLIIGGCTSSGAFLAANQTIVSLEDGNYSIAASNVMGESESAYILGLSYSTGVSASTLAIARVEGTGMLYAEALENLWTNFEMSGEDIEGEKLALTNVRYDSDILNLVIYTKVKVTVRADIVRFD